MLSQPILSYQGPLSFSTIDALLSRFKVAAQEHDLSFRVYKKMLCVMIEALENISKYCSAEGQNRCNDSGLPPRCMINHDSRYIELVTTNLVRNEDVEALRSKIEQVNRSDRDQLKVLYRNTITNGRFSPQGGAGLGFIEMAKTTGNKLEYKFEHLDRNYSLYTLRTVMKLHKERPS